MKKIFVSLLFGLLIVSGIVFANSNLNADSNLKITSPAEGDSIDSDTMITAETTANAVCEYKIDSGPFVTMGTTGTMYHTQTIPPLSPGSHTAHIHCNIENANEKVTFSVPAAIPEFPTPIIPALLAIASLGIVSFRIK